MKRKGWMRLMVLAGAVCLLTGCGKAQKAYNKGMELATAGKYEKSLSYFQEAIKEKDDRAEYYIGYGMALCHLNRYEEAKEEFGKILQESGNKISKENNKQLYYGMALAEYGLGEYDSTADYCDKALAITYLEDMDSDILYAKMAAYCQKGEWQKAVDACEQLCEENKKDMDAYMALAYAAYQSGDKERAVQAYQDAIAADETYYDAYFALYEQYAADGQTEQAQEYLNPILALNTNKAENMLAIGRAYFYQQEYDTAKKYLDMAYDGNCKESLYYSGILAAAQGEYEEAATDFQNYIKENKESLNVEVYYQLALVYMEQEAYEKAQSMLTKGLSYGMTAAAQKLKKTQVILLEKQKDYEEAKTQAEEYIQCYPADTQMQKELSFIQTRIS